MSTLADRRKLWEPDRPPTGRSATACQHSFGVEVRLASEAASRCVLGSTNCVRHLATEDVETPARRAASRSETLPAPREGISCATAAARGQPTCDRELV